MAKHFTTDLSKHLDHSFIHANFHNELVALSKGAVKARHFEDKRAFIRSFAAMVEGVGFQLRQFMLREHDLGKIHLNTGEQVVLSETKHILTDSGKLRATSNFHPTLPMFRFTVDCYARHFRRTAEVVPMFSESGWNDFRTTFAKRDQLTHPKEAKHIFVSAPEWKAADGAWSWFHKLYIALLEGSILVEKEGR